MIASTFWKKTIHGKHGMREAGLFGLMMMLAKVAGRVEELLGNNRRFDVNFVTPEERPVAINADIRGSCAVT